MTRGASAKPNHSNCDHRCVDLPDTLAIMTGGGGFLGGFAGLIAPFQSGRQWLDNGQRGFFFGAWLGAAGAFVIYLGAEVAA